MKRFVLMTLVLVLVLTVVGCGDISSNDYDTPGKTEATISAEQTEVPMENDSAQYVVFGAYEQDGNVDNGPEQLQWIPLAEKDGKILLICRYIIDYRDFNESTLAKASDWKGSSLRKWLNEDFYKTAFSSSEQKKIAKTKVQDYKADGALGGTTTDKVFILSKEQAFTYFTSNSARATTSTAYAQKQKSYPNDGYWLIDSYGSNLYKCLVNSEGKNENNPRVNENEGVRPVIWINKK